jgi:glyoxylate/hydroxypyruvate reductase A
MATLTGKTVILVEGIDHGAWVSHLAAALPEFDVRGADDPGVDPRSVTHVVMWKLPAERLASYPHLEAILVMGAGYNHLDLTALPDVPIIRLVDPAMADDIALYVLSWVIHFQRDFDRFAVLAQSGTWRGEWSPIFARDFTVGVFGAGAIGQTVLDTCARHGFATVGWSRSNHDRPLLQFFADCDVVVDLVPLSDATRGVIAVAELAALDNGVLINVGRGATVDSEALLAALDGPLRAAVLDVFETEPLPADSPFWQHPAVTVTPHIAGRSDPVTAASVIAGSVGALRAGNVPAGVISR